MLSFGQLLILLLVGLLLFGDLRAIFHRSLVLFVNLKTLFQTGEKSKDASGQTEEKKKKKD